MMTVILSAMLTAAAAADDPGRKEARRLVATMESLLRPVADFRCEFQGTQQVRGEVAKSMFLAEDETADAYRGIYIWKAGGDTRVEAWHREAVTTQVRRESIAVRAKPPQSELHSRFHERSINATRSTDPHFIQTWRASMGTIFLLERIRREVADPNNEPRISDRTVNGRPLRVLTIGLAGLPDVVICRYWIDLERSGQVVRQENYMGRDALSLRLDVKLARFRLGDAEVWMPVSGESVGYLAIVDRKPTIMKESQVIERVSVVEGTLAFNSRPAADVFTLRYDPVGLASGELRKIELEYRRQKDVAPLKPEIEAQVRGAPGEGAGEHLGTGCRRDDGRIRLVHLAGVRLRRDGDRRADRRRNRATAALIVRGSVPPSGQARISRITWPWTSVRRRSMPLWRKVSRVWSMPSRCSTVACRS